MKKESLLNIVGSIDDEFIEKALPEEKSAKNGKRTKRLRFAAAAACLFAAVAIGIPLISGHFSDHSEVFDPSEKQKDPNVFFSSEEGYVFEWEYLSDHERFTSVNCNGMLYLASYTAAINEDSIGEKLEDSVAFGYDTHDKKYTKECEIYSVKGIDSDYYVAVRLEGEREFYSFRANNSVFPYSLGDFMECFSVTEYLPLSKCAVYENNEMTGYYPVSDDVSSEVWKMLKQHSDAGISDASLDFSNEFRGDNYISFTVNSPEYGVTRNVFTVYDTGYIFTNVNSYGYIINIGEDSAKEIISYVKKNMGNEEIPYVFSYNIIGTVTEIGEDHFKIDTSATMKNPNDGIIVTVKIRDITIERYFIKNIVKVGSFVSVEYDGNINTETYEIDDPLGIQTGVLITENGDIEILE